MTNHIEFIEFQELSSNNLIVLKALQKLTSNSRDRFTVSEITNYLVEIIGYDISSQAVTSLLLKNKKLVNKNKFGYKLMGLGIEEIANTALSSRGIYLEAGKPYSSKNVDLSSYFKNLVGSAKIIDPYFDILSIDFIYKNFSKDFKIDFLTTNCIDKPVGILARTITDLNAEGFNLEVRKYTKSILHDRFIIDNTSIWLSGNSLNHIGQKESYIVKLGEDTRLSMLETFMRRWKVSTSL